MLGASDARGPLHLFAAPTALAGLLLLTSWVGPAVGGGSSKASPAGAGTELSSTAIQRWIEQLNSDRYIERERATRKLIQAGRSALEPVAAAADSDVLEVATRAVRILLELSDEQHGETARMALHQIARLEHRPAERKAAEAILGGMRESEALVEIARLGGIQRLRQTVDGRQVVGHLVLDRKWQGGDDGLRHLSAIRWLQVLSIHGTPVTDAGVALLKATSALKRIELYGTEVSQQGVEALQKKAPTAVIDYRRGALLGVQGIGGQEGARITHVAPGSAAAKAGLMTADIIAKFDGRPVKDFQALTRLVAAHRAGDRAELEVVRGDRRLTVQVTFGAWR